MRKSIFLIGILAFLSLVACDQNPECNQSTLSGVKFSLSKNKVASTLTLSDTIFNDGEIVSIDTRDTIVYVYRSSLPVWFHSAGSESDTIYSTSYVDSLQILPLSTGLSSTSYFLRYGDEENEIVFNYSDELVFLDIPCGFISNFTLESIAFDTTSFIDSIIFISPIADNDVSTENIKIYYH